jgi:hypothetical protein
MMRACSAPRSPRSRASRRADVDAPLTTTLLLVRHAETDDNATMRLFGLDGYRPLAPWRNPGRAF